jgi:hypothetical protein
MSVSMKRLVFSSLLLAVQLASASTFASGLCEEPAALAQIPSGATATRDQMLSAQRAIKAYDLAVKAYSDCLHESGDTSSRGIVAVERLQQMADRFNTELRMFKERNGAS